MSLRLDKLEILVENTKEKRDLAIVQNMIPLSTTAEHATP